MRKVSRIPYVCAAISLGLFYGYLLSWSLYRTSLLELFPSLTAGDLSVVYSVHLVFIALTNLSFGFLRKKLSARTITRIAAFFLGGGVFLFSFLPVENPGLAYFLMIFFYGVIAPIGVALAQSSTITNYVKWFPERMGLMNGLILMAFMASPLVLGAATTALADSIGFFNAFKVLGVAIFLVLFFGAHWSVEPAPDIALPPMPQFKENQGDKDYTLKQILTSPVFWCLFLFESCTRGVSFTLSDHAATITMAFGMSAIFGMVYSPAAAASCVISGLFLNKLGVQRVITIIAVLMLCSCGLLVVFSLAELGVGILICMIGIGIIFGGMSGISSTILRIMFGEKNFSMAYSFNAPTTLVSAILGMTCGRILDALGGFVGVFVFMFILSIIATVCVLALRKSIRERNGA